MGDSVFGGRLWAAEAHVHEVPLTVAHLAKPTAKPFGHGAAGTAGTVGRGETTGLHGAGAARRGGLGLPRRANESGRAVLGC